MEPHCLTIGSRKRIDSLRVGRLNKKGGPEGPPSYLLAEMIGPYDRGQRRKWETTVSQLPLR